MPNYIGIHMNLDMCKLTGVLIFSLWFLNCSFVLALMIYCLKCYCYIYMAFNLFAFGRDRFFTVYICFKETLFFIFFIQTISKCYSCFYYKIMKKAVHVHNYRFLWKGLCLNYGWINTEIWEVLFKFVNGHSASGNPHDLADSFEFELTWKLKHMILKIWKT